MPSAGSAFSAAIAGVSSPFATRRSTAPDDHPPPPGSDSCFGVRSLEGSVQWSPDDDDAAATPSHHPEHTGSNSGSGSGSASEQTSDDDDAEAFQDSEQPHQADPYRTTTSACSASTSEHLADAIASRIPGSAPAPTPAPAPSPPMPIPALRHTNTSSSSTSNNSSSASSASTSTQGPMSQQTPHAERTMAGLGLAPPASPNSQQQHHRQGRSSTPQSSPAIPHSPSPARSRRGAPEALPVPPPIQHHTLLDMLADAPSEPSSPASLASIPSCVASMSSLSRMSSPPDWDWRHPLSRSAHTVDSRSDHEPHSGLEDDPHSGSAELVLPTLALPSTSLHLGLERWNTPGQGTRIALIATPERTRDVLGALAARRACVQLPRGEVGVLFTPAPGSSFSSVSDSGSAASIHPPTIQATIVTCLSTDHVRQRVSEAYTALHALLHPAPTRQQQAGLDAIVAAYASSKDWIHLAVLLDDAAEDGTDIDIVPCTTLEEQALAQEQLGVHTSEGDEMPSSASVSPTSSFSLGSSLELPPDPRQARGDASSGTSAASGASSKLSLSIHDTPRPALDSLQPWPVCDAPTEEPQPIPEEHKHTLHDSLLESHGDLMNADPCDPVFGTVALLERIIDDPGRVHAASTAAFFDWRPTPLPDIASPLTGPYTSPASSTFEGAGPMPTVARAQGGGEWEATLSRRLAHRRELDNSVERDRQKGIARPRGRGRGGARRRRSHSPPDKPVCPTPLFPRRPIASSVGLVDLLDAAFAPVRRFTRTTFGQVVVACAIAVAVGCGIWAVRTQA